MLTFSQALAKTFNSDQPRDADGRWTDAGASFWNAVKPHDAALSGDAGRAIDAWVGGPHDTVQRGLTGGLMIPEHLESMSREALDAMAAPIREAAKAAYGDTVQVYRAEVAGASPSTGRQGNLWSFTTDKDIAESFAGARKDVPLISDADVSHAEHQLEQTGETELGGYTFRRETQQFRGADITSINMYRGDNYITDTHSLRAEADDMNDSRAEQNAENAAARATVSSYTIPTDSIVWATDRFNQREIIATKPVGFWKMLTFDQAIQLQKAFNPNQARDNRGRWTSGGASAAVSPENPKGKPAAGKMTGPPAEVAHLLLNRRKLTPGKAAAGLIQALAERGHKASLFDGKTRQQFGEWVQGVARRIPGDVMISAALNVPSDVDWNQFDERRRAAVRRAKAGKHTHAEVDYQDHPHDGQQCDKCWKFQKAISPTASTKLVELLQDGLGVDIANPHCLKVQDPISPTGWCRKFEQQATPGVEAFHVNVLDAPGVAAMVGKFAPRIRAALNKAFDPDQPRDAAGRWEGGGSGGERDISLPMSPHSYQDMRAAYVDASGEKDPETVRVKVSDLRATQDKVYVTPQHGISDKPIHGMRDAAGNIHVINGHHRADAAMLRGDDTIDAKVFDMKKAFQPGDVGKYSPGESRNRRGRWSRSRHRRTHKALSFIDAMDKAFDADQPRDDHGRWTGTGDAAAAIADKGKLVPAFKHDTTGEIVTGERGQTHGGVARSHNLEGGRIDRVYSRWTPGFFHPEHGFVSKEESGIDSPELMTPEQHRAWLDSLGKAFDPNEPRDKEGEWTSGGGGLAGNPSSDRQGAGAFGDGKSVYTHIMDWRIGRHADKVADLEAKAKDLTAQLAQHPNVSDDAHPAIRQNLMETNAALWTARQDLKSLHEERDHPFSTAFNAVKDTLLGKAVSFDDMMKAFDPNQPRDGRGRWTSGGGTGGGVGGNRGTGMADVSPVAEVLKPPREITDHLVALKEAGTDRDLFDRAIAGMRAGKLPPKDVKALAQTYAMLDPRTKLTARTAYDYIERAFIQNARFERKIARYGRAVSFGEAMAKRSLGEVAGAMSFGDALDMMKKFNPDQPRDGRGRWTSMPGDTAVNWNRQLEGRERWFPPGGVHNALPRIPKGQGTDLATRGKFWVYDHDWNLLDTFKTLATAKTRAMAHTLTTNMPAYLYDSENHREARTVTMLPGAYATREPKWATTFDPKTGVDSGKMAWRDTSNEDALVERFARERAQWERENGPVGKALFYGMFRKNFAKAFNPDEERDTKGRWTAIEAAQSTAKDLMRIMDKARLEDAHSAVSPEHDRNWKLLTTSSLDEWTSPIEHVQDAKDFKPGTEHYDESTPAERQQYRQQLHEDLDGIHEEIQGHNKALADGLEKYAQRVDAYAARVRDTLGKVRDRIAQGPTAKAFDPEQARDNHGRWTASIVTESDPIDRQSKIMTVHSSEDSAETARSRREAHNQSDGWEDNREVRVHHVPVQGAGDRVNVVSSTDQEGRPIIHSVTTDKAEAMRSAEQMSRDAWQTHGRDMDYEDVWEAKPDSWDKAKEAWNAANPGKEVPEEGYRFGTYPAFERAYEAEHMDGLKAPYPGLNKANNYFVDDHPEHVYEVSGRRVNKAFDPSQPRAEDGKWSGSSGDQTALRAARDRVKELTGRMTRLHDVDASEDIYWGTQRSLELARQDLQRQEGRMASMGKAFQPPGRAIMFTDVMKYRADQARDARGRWTSGGGGTSSGGADAKPASADIGGYLSRLEAALGKPHFEEEYSRLKADKSVSAPDMKQLLRQFTGASARNRTDALRRIRERQDMLMSFKIGTSAGRSAA